MRPRLAASAVLLALASAALGQVVHVPSYPLNGDSFADLFGDSVSDAGDVNNDGFDDFIVGALRDDNHGADSGSARVFSGADGSILYTFNGDSAGDEFGYSVSGAGDVNNDGFDDLIVGAWHDDNNGPDSGSARVFSGANGSILYTFNGDSADAVFGSSVSGAGDVNGDGFDDIIAGGPGNFGGVGTGMARVFSGADGSILYTFNGDSARDRFGYSVSGAGDVNNDGFDDFIVGAPSDYNGPGAGSARVFSGIDGSILYTFNGDSRGDEFGFAVSDAGDVNNDGFDDIIVGAWRNNNIVSNSGSARVFSGFDGAILYTFSGDSESEYFGSSVSGAGDVNGDGFDDLIAGAWGDNINGIQSGSARVFSGFDGVILYTFIGDSFFDSFGQSVSGAGDVNNDGLDDFIVGAPGDSNNGFYSGSARVFLSVPTPAAPTPCPGDANGDQGVNFADLNTVLSNFGGACTPGTGGPGLAATHAPAFPIFTGVSVADQFGRSVSGAGDVNGDGFDDFIVGATIGLDDGARVFSGADGSVLYTFNGDSASDDFGYSVSGAGDVNNDGFDDLIVGAPLDDNNGSDSGAARVFSGANGAILYTFIGPSPGAKFGWSVSGAGDVNNDGFDDLIVGAPEARISGNRPGRARVFSGFNGSVLYTFDGASDGDRYGNSVSSAGDVNNDGFDDLIVGAPLADNSNGPNSGIARVFSGVDGSILYTFDGEIGTTFFGQSVSGAGDVNNDGSDDLIVGAPFTDSKNGFSSGSARVFSGVDGALLYTFYGHATGVEFGRSVSGVGDVNNDGFDDLIVGAPRDIGNGAISGSARVFSGANGSILYTFIGDSADDDFGRSVSGAGDVNNDGVSDFIVGAPRDDNNGLESGSAFVFRSVRLPAASICPGDLNGDNLVNFSDLNGVLSNFGQSCPE